MPHTFLDDLPNGIIIYNKINEHNDYSKYICEICPSYLKDNRSLKLHLDSKKHKSNSGQENIYTTPNNKRLYIREWSNKKLQNIKNTNEYKQLLQKKKDRYNENKKETTKEIKKTNIHTLEKKSKPKTIEVETKKIQPKKIQPKKTEIYEYNKIGTKQFTCNICKNENKIFTNENGHRKNIQHKINMKENPEIIRGHKLQF